MIDKKLKTGSNEIAQAFFEHQQGIDQLHICQDRISDHETIKSGLFKDGMNMNQITESIEIEKALDSLLKGERNELSKAEDKIRIAQAALIRLIPVKNIWIEIHLYFERQKDPEIFYIKASKRNDIYSETLFMWKSKEDFDKEQKKISESFGVDE